MPEHKEPNFEASMKRLNEIVESLEAGDLTLDESLKLYEEGVRISKSCAKRLDDAQQRIDTLMRSSSGELESAELDAETLKGKGRKPKGR